jgi:transposase, IS5 family
MSQLSFLSIAQAKKELKRDKFLNQMKAVIPWDKLCKVIQPFYTEHQLGRKRKPLERMLKILCLQNWYSLSDPGVEEEIYDRNSFQKFLDLDLLLDSVPDETTILNFRHLLEDHNLFKAIFDEISNHLVQSGFLMKTGTIVDATLISAPSSTKNKSGKRDPEMSSTKKNNTWHFGMKAHIGVDERSGLVHSIRGTTAKVHDSKVFEELIHGNEFMVYGDKAYASKALETKMQSYGITWGVSYKASPHNKLSEFQEESNRLLSKIRCRVEHPFQVIKCQWKYTKARYRGIKKNLDQLHLLFGLFNLFKVRKKLLVA